MVGSACWRLLKKEGYQNLIGKSSNELDLRNQKEVFTFFENEKPDIVIDAAAKVGGIWVNNEYPYEFLMDNMLIQNNLINSSLKNNIKKFIFLGSSCIYPKNAPQPLKEEYLLTSELEPTNQWYAIAKISGVKLIESIRKQFGYDYVSLMPTNLYGPGDNYDLKTSHVLPALIRKYHEAKLNGESVTLWGTGNPLREFLHVDDLARAILLFVKNESKDYLYNIGSGQEISIRDLSTLIFKLIGFNGETIWDNSMPDGTKRKLLDSSKIQNLGFKPQIDLKKGIIEICNQLNS
jgi:GDP-L-fucose synthase